MIFKIHCSAFYFLILYKCNLYNNINKIKDGKNKPLNIFCMFYGSNYVILLLYLQCRVMLHGTISIEKTYGWNTF
nr:MAG TPA: hypothetical protein [Caudoviricetes sp.]